MTFEQDYYEAPEFWTEGMVSDALNLERIAETISMIPTDVTSLLDVGCGNGVFPNKLKSSFPGLKIVATDRSKEALKYVLTEKFESDITEISTPTDSFDCVTCLQVLEHIPVPIYDTALSELARVSKKYIIISIPFNEVLQNSFTKCPQCLSEFNSDLHLRSYNSNDLENLFLPHGYKLIQYKNVVKWKKYLGIEIYSKLRSFFIQSQPRSFNSPICPICGFKNKSFKVASTKASESVVMVNRSKIKSFIKSYWPLVDVPGYWGIALYSKID